MRLILLRATCDDGRTCPNINATDRGTHLVQGYPVTGLDLGGHMPGPDEAVVEIQASLLPELAADDVAHGAVRPHGAGDALGVRSPRRGGGVPAGTEHSGRRGRC